MCLFANRLGPPEWLSYCDNKLLETNKHFFEYTNCLIQEDCFLKGYNTLCN